jgi:hypothetical protein
MPSSVLLGFGVSDLYLAVSKCAVRVLNVDARIKKIKRGREETGRFREPCNPVGYLVSLGRVTEASEIWEIATSSSLEPERGAISQRSSPQVALEGDG